MESRLALRIWAVHFCNLVLYLRGKRCSAENTQYKLKKCELDCFSPFEQMQMPIPIMGTSLHCNWFFCSSLLHRISNKNDFTLFGSLSRQVYNKMKAWLPASDHTVWKYSIYWHVANFPEKQEDRAFDSAAVNILDGLQNYTWSWKWSKISATCNIWVWSLKEKVSKWRDGKLINVLYYKAYKIILIADVKIGVEIKKNKLKKPNTHTLGKKVQVREQSFPLIPLDRAAVWGAGNPT